MGGSVFLGVAGFDLLAEAIARFPFLLSGDMTARDFAQISQFSTQVQLTLGRNATKWSNDRKSVLGSVKRGRNCVTMSQLLQSPRLDPLLWRSEELSFPETLEV